MTYAIERPQAHEHLPYYSRYIELVSEPDVLQVLEAQRDDLRRLAMSIPAARETFRYAPDKWSVREVFGHIVDLERIFGYRALRISRRDETPLPGFDENTYIANGVYDTVGLKELADEFSVVRESNLVVLRRLDGSHAAAMGSANGAAVSVRALAYIMAGHVRHHVNVLHERYGV